VLFTDENVYFVVRDWILFGIKKAGFYPARLTTLCRDAGKRICQNIRVQIIEIFKAPVVQIMQLILLYPTDAFV
jgi:hypothetical protein